MSVILRLFHQAADSACFIVKMLMNFGLPETSLKKTWKALIYPRRVILQGYSCPLLVNR